MDTALLDGIHDDALLSFFDVEEHDLFIADHVPQSDDAGRDNAEPDDASGCESSAGLRLRARRLLAREIEYIDSPCFERPNAEAEILGPFPSSEKSGRGGNQKTAAPPPNTPPYLAALYGYPLLTKEQEQYLFRRMNYLKHRAAQLRNDLDPDRPRAELVGQIEQDLAEALAIRNRIVRSNLRLVVSIAKKVVDPANGFDDVVSDGNVPLIRAVEIFDFERGTRFSTYATWAIRNSLFRSTPRNRKRRKRFRSGNDAVFEAVSDPRRSQHEQESFHRRLRQSLKRLLSKLDDRDRMIVVDRFGLDETGRPKRFREIADKLNISTERVRQLLARSLDRLHRLAEKEPIEPA